MKKNPLKIKEALYLQCINVVNDRFQTIQNTISEIQVSLTSETKSSAGDKHETGRAMLQLEREKAGNQLAEIQKVKEILSKIDISKTLKVVGLGSIVYTSKANYFIAISVGELTVDGVRFYAISPSTPIGRLLMGKQFGDEVIFRERKFIVQEII
ncbi:3-oxoacyl-ACP synthase [Flavivirga sp. 57AJ16]|uniref:3-oxoacyl-ACP synthase n=1 Tax=Flavivirga sp. 57AJ16 TaxID=3025307 RepID=UPI0023673298|nr:3-oxoacyl-ACP synthase [Flavivirga sp. 57AJ16]MDD7886065.1 3-oxoacyl-ACP synthase [Flavivirga sp. 57AJ16]